MWSDIALRFVLFTEKTTHQCMKALHERLQATATKSRPELDGWIEKNGRFSISMTTPVLGKFSRRTRLRGVAEREKGVTVIRGFVPNGLSNGGLAVLATVLAVLAFYFLLTGELMLGLLVILAGTAMLIPLWGDYRNHDVLLYELERTLKAKPAPSKAKRGKK